MKTPRSGYTLVETPIGSCGIAWEGDRVKCIQLPEASDEETLARMRVRAGDLSEGKPPAWVHALGLAITRHLRGESQSFDAVPLDLDGLPPFRRKVYEAARKVGAAKTATSPGSQGARAPSARRSRRTRSRSSSPATGSSPRGTSRAGSRPSTASRRRRSSSRRRGRGSSAAREGSATTGTRRASRSPPPSPGSRA